MRRLRYLLWLGLIAILTTGYFILRSFGLLGMPEQARAREVPRGDQEVAYIQAATNGASWERFVAGLQRVQKKHPNLIVDESNAFPEQSAAVPEVSLSFPGVEGKLWIRWYKLTSAAGSQAWVDELSKRETPPLALIGGGSSDRARDLAAALEARRNDWHGAPPLLLITTATANAVNYPDDLSPVTEPLTCIYKDLTYRFCFTNSQMAEAMWEFVWIMDDLRPFTKLYHFLPAGMAQAVAGDLWGSLAMLHWGALQPQPVMVHIVEWVDDPYSRDLAQQFRNVFTNPDNPPLPRISLSVDYSVGGFMAPNPSESLAVQSLIDLMPPSSDHRFLLVLPATDKPARRFLRALSVNAPRDVNNVVVVTGDSISFNTLYRDRHTNWNIQSMPVPIVAFCHQNPVDWDQAAVMPGAGPQTTGTEEELLNADIVELLVEAAFRLKPAAGDAPGKKSVPAPVLIDSAALLNQEIIRRRADYFAEDGNRRGGSGEYVICLRPRIESGRVRPEATLEVWSRRIPEPGRTSWQRIKKLDLDYAENRRGMAP